MRILVIEDQEKIARGLAKALTREGYAVDIEHDSTEGFGMASTQPYDALIVDRMLPGEYKDGADMIAALRKENIYTPALLLTALSQTQQKTEGLDLGADDYMTKPFAIDELLARIRALTRRPSEQRSVVLSVGDITVDTTKRTVSVGSKEVSLTNKEFRLLEFLVLHKGQTMSKEQIIEHVWNFDADILPNTVEVFIKSLRKKIDAPFKKKYITTVRGVGYKIEASNAK